MSAQPDLCPCCSHTSADPESFLRRGPILARLFFVDKGRREDLNYTKSGPISAHQRADDGSIVNAGLVAL